MGKTKRVPVILQAATHRALEELANASCQSISSLVSQFMDEAAPSFASLAEAFRQAKTSPMQAIDLMQESLAKAQHHASQGQLDIVETRKLHNKRRPKT